MQGKVEIAGVNTSKLKVLKSSETMDLLRRSKSGDKQAREELIEGNLRLVLSVIQRFAGRGESVDDLFQVGCVGLIKAIDNFDITQPVRFSTFPCIAATCLPSLCPQYGPGAPSLYWELLSEIRRDRTFPPRHRLKRG